VDEDVGKTVTLVFVAKSIGCLKANRSKGTPPKGKLRNAWPRLMQRQKAVIRAALHPACTGFFNLTQELKVIPSHD